MIDDEIRARQLLLSATQAAKSQSGFWVQFFGWLERRAERRQLAKALVRCRDGQHETRNWKFQRVVEVWSSSDPAAKYPTSRYENFTGFCVHCRAPTVVRRPL